MNRTDGVQARQLYSRALRAAGKLPPDYAFAADLLQEASRLGSANADYALATWYLFGRHFKKDIKKGLRLLKRAQKAGNADACYDLAVSYDNGIGVPKSAERAFELYLEGALRGEVESIGQVARCFWVGSGVKKNRTLAWLWDERYQAELTKRKGKAKPKASVARITQT